MAGPPGDCPAGEALVRHRRVALIWNVNPSEDEDEKRSAVQLLYPAVVLSISKRTKKVRLRYTDEEETDHDLSEFAEGTFLILPEDCTCSGNCRALVDLSKPFSAAPNSPLVCSICTAPFHSKCAAALRASLPIDTVAPRPNSINEATAWVCPICEASRACAAAGAPFERRISLHPTNPALLRVCGCAPSFAADILDYIPRSSRVAESADLLVLSAYLPVLNRLRRRYLQKRKPRPRLPPPCPAVSPAPAIGASPVDDPREAHKAGEIGDGGESDRAAGDAECCDRRQSEPPVPPQAVASDRDGGRSGRGEALGAVPAAGDLSVSWRRTVLGETNGGETGVGGNADSKCVGASVGVAAAPGDDSRPLTGQECPTGVGVATPDQPLLTGMPDGSGTEGGGDPREGVEGAAVASKSRSSPTDVGHARKATEPPLANCDEMPNGNTAPRTSGQRPSRARLSDERPCCPCRGLPVELRDSGGACREVSGANANSSEDMSREAPAGSVEHSASVSPGLLTTSPRDADEQDSHASSCGEANASGNLSPSLAPALAPQVDRSALALEDIPMLGPSAVSNERVSRATDESKSAGETHAVDREAPKQSGEELFADCRADVAGVPSHPPAGERQSLGDEETNKSLPQKARNGGDDVVKDVVSAEQQERRAVRKSFRQLQSTVSPLKLSGVGPDVPLAGSNCGATTTTCVVDPKAAIGVGSKRERHEASTGGASAPKKRPRASADRVRPFSVAALGRSDPTCIFCRRAGSLPECEGNLVGPLKLEKTKNGQKSAVPIHFHRNCMLWASGPEEKKKVVKGVEKSAWSNFEATVGRSFKVGGKKSRWADSAGKCHLCQGGGASLLCMFESTRCSKPMHFRCALERGGGFHIDELGRRLTCCPEHQLGPFTKKSKAISKEDLCFQTPVPKELLDATASEGQKVMACCQKDMFDFELGGVLTCGSCAKSFHTSCVLPNLSSRASGSFAIDAMGGKFRCASCDPVCLICSEVIGGSSERMEVSTAPMIGPANFDESARKDAVGQPPGNAPPASDVVKCVGCNLNAVHKHCFDEVLAANGDNNVDEPFRCECCRACLHCGRTRVDPNAWVESIGACDSCSKLHSDGHVCPVCQRAYPASEVDMICCDKCNKWVHFLCSGMSPEEFDFAGDQESSSFVCEPCRSTKPNPRKRKRVGSAVDKPAESVDGAYVEEFVEESGGVLAEDVPVIEGQLKVAAEDEPESAEDSEEESFVDYLHEAQKDVELFAWPRQGSLGNATAGELAPSIDLCRRCGSGGDPMLMRFCSSCGDAVHGFCNDVPLPCRFSVDELRSETMSNGTRVRLTSGGLGIDAPLWRCDRCALCKRCGIGGSDLYACRRCGERIHSSCLCEEERGGLLVSAQRTTICLECQQCDRCGKRETELVEVGEKQFCALCAPAATSEDSRGPPFSRQSIENVTPVASTRPDAFESITTSVAQSSVVPTQPLGSLSVSRTGDENIQIGASNESKLALENRSPSVSDSDRGSTAYASGSGLSGRRTERGIAVRGYGLGEADKGPGKAGPDVRVCELCGVGESLSCAGRLIPWSSKPVGGFKSPVWWVHAMCALWTSGVRLAFPPPCPPVEGAITGKDSSAVSVSESVRRTCFIVANRREVSALRSELCTKCGKVGATLRCAKEDCKVRYHYMCALESNCRMHAKSKGSESSVSSGAVDLQDVRSLIMHCATHADEGSDSSTIADDSAGGSVTLSGSRMLSVDIPLRFESPGAEKSVFDGKQRIRVGGLVVTELGRLVPNCALFVQNHVLIPTNMMVARHHWSLRNPGHRCVYVMEVLGSPRSGPLFSIRCSDDPRLKIRASTAEGAWKQVASALEWMRSSWTSFSDASLVSMTGYDAFGLTNCHATVFSIEALPMAALLKGRYNFAWGEPEPLRDMPFAAPEFLCRTGSVNLDSCARGEGFLPATSEDPSAPTYENEPSGRRFQTEVALRLNQVSNEGDDLFNCPGERHDTLWKVSRSQKARNGESKARNGEKSRTGDPIEDAIRTANGAYSSKTSLYSQSYAMQHRAMEKSWRRRTVVLRSRIEGWGVFATEDILTNEMIIEYMGEIIRPITSDKRENRYDSRGIGCYMFEVEPGRIVDATMRGNRARYINHSCDPNCHSRTVKVENGRRAICIFASRDIRRGEELCYNYQFPLDEEDRVKCACGAKTCSGFMN